MEHIPLSLKYLNNAENTLLYKIICTKTVSSTVEDNFIVFNNALKKNFKCLT